MDNQEIGHRISQRRAELNLSLQEIAKRVGVASSTVLRYEKGEVAKVKIPVIDAISKALGLNPAWVCGKKVDKFLDDGETDNVVPITGMVPIVGVIPAGQPLLAQENIEGYMPTMVKRPSEYFALHVHGVRVIAILK